MDWGEALVGRYGPVKVSTKGQVGMYGLGGGLSRSVGRWIQEAGGGALALIGLAGRIDWGQVLRPVWVSMDWGRGSRS
jgi:hypothetical protein